MDGFERETLKDVTETLGYLSEGLDQLLEYYYDLELHSRLRATNAQRMLDDLEEGDLKVAYWEDERVEAESGVNKFGRRIDQVEDFLFLIDTDAEALETGYDLD